MRRTVLLVGMVVLLVAIAAGTALAALRIGNDKPNDLFGTRGDNQGQDTLLGYGAGDELVGRSAADQLAGGFGPDRLEGNDGNDTLDGGRGEDRIFTGRGFDFVYAADGHKDYINCNGQREYRVVFDAGLDRFDRCPGSNTTSTSAASANKGQQRIVSVN